MKERVGEGGGGGGWVVNEELVVVRGNWGSEG